jgi:membrane protein DedA with SNARE-associated domain/rhodanese-related sulfurtransferase
MGGVAQLTYTGIGLAVFARQLCLPVPAVVFLMAAGTMAAQGRLHVWLLLVVGILGCLAGDGIWFWLGKHWGGNVIRLVCSLTSDPMRSRERSRITFERWGLRLLVIAKFVPGLDSIAPPLAGASGASVAGFLAYDAAGSLLWTAAYLALGFVFASQLDRVMQMIQRFGTILLIVVGAPLFLYVAWRAIYLARVIRHLRLRRISPALLQKMMDNNEKVAIFDLLHFEARDGNIPGIPGAVRVDPTRMRKAIRVEVPEGFSVVLYCASKNELASARVAESLKKRGIRNVWVLEGGLAAWELEGRHVTVELSTPEEVAARLGIVLPPEMRQVRPA